MATMTITKRAVYRDGSLRLDAPIDIPEDTPVRVDITVLISEPAESESLFGTFPELAALTIDDFAWARRLWEHGVETQSRILDGVE